MSRLFKNGLISFAQTEINRCTPTMPSIIKEDVRSVGSDQPFDSEPELLREQSSEEKLDCCGCLPRSLMENTHPHRSKWVPLYWYNVLFFWN